MRKVRYSKHWSYIETIHEEAMLVHFILDIFYLMEDTGVIPPYSVLNHVLGTGGDNGGMSPGTTWRPFQIAHDEYDELRAELLCLDMDEVKVQHPYIRFERIIEDEELARILEPYEWWQAARNRYARDTQ